MYLCVHWQTTCCAPLAGCILSVHAIARGVFSCHASLERPSSTNYQVSNVSRLLTNPNALFVTVGMEYISACVSTWLVHDHDTTSDSIMQDIAVRSPHGPGSIWTRQKQLKKARPLQCDYGSEKMFAGLGSEYIPTNFLTHPVHRIHHG